MITNIQDNNKINGALAWGDFSLERNEKRNVYLINPLFTSEMTVINF